MNRRTALAALLGAGALTSGVALTATSGWLVVRASERPIILTLLTAIVAVRTFGMARPALRYAERLRSHDAALDDLACRRPQVYAALVPLTPARLAHRGRAAMLGGVVDDLTESVEAQVRVTVPLLASGFASVAAVALTASLDLRVGFVVAALVLVAALTTQLAWRLESRGRDDLDVARATTTRTSELVAGNALELGAIGAGAEALDWVARAQAGVRASVRRQSLGRAVAAAVLPLATAVATVAAAGLVAPGRHGAPVAALLVLTPFALAEVFAGLPDAAAAAARARAADRRLAALLALTPAVRAEGTRALALPDGWVPRLDLHDVTASWDGARTDLPGTSLQVAPGAVVAVTGPSGCGKSTLLAVLARHLDPASGRYEVDGVDATELLLEDVRALFAVVDDDPHVFAATVRENLRLARPDASDQDAVSALSAAGLGDWFAGLPTGLDTLLGAHGRGLSGGERARLAVARALLSGRPVVLLDEAVAHLDHATATAVMDDLVAGRAGRSIVVVSHRREGLEHAQAIMELGEATGARAEVRQR